MKIIATSLATLMLLGAYSAASAQDRVTTRTVVTHRDMNREMHRGPAVRKVVVRHDRGLHRGWAHSEHRGRVVRKRVIIER